MEVGERRGPPVLGWSLSPLRLAALILIALTAAWSFRSPKRLALHPPEEIARHPAESIALPRDERPVAVPAPAVTPTARRVPKPEPARGARAFPPSREPSAHRRSLGE